MSMDLQDATRNQHFLPRVEQRLNSINPNAHEKNQRIYAFELEDKETYSIRLVSDKGLKINKSLTLNDLFSFDVLEKEAARYNFEKLFQQYESDIKFNTQSLLSKIPNPQLDIKSEVLNIFVSKFLNFVRNPYSIKKVLNSFPHLATVHPTEPVHLKNFECILNGRKPQQKCLCEQLEIFEHEYTEWLAVIFMLLTRFEDDKPNFIEQVVKSLYENPDSFIMVIIYTYDEKTCLLSDRGYSIPLPEEAHMSFDFNLCSNAFIRYIFGDINKLAPSNAPNILIERFKTMTKSVDVHNIVNDLDALEQYNKHVVYQCLNTVFNSSIECYGLQVAAWNSGADAPPLVNQAL